jgi:fibronectin type 3 domain-containing protein
LSASVGATIAVPAVPAGLTVEPVSSTSLKVSWDPVPGAMLYSIYRNDYNDDVYASNIITSTTNTEYVDTGLEPFRRYYYKVSAVNDIGTGNLSATAVSAYTQPIPLTNGTWYDNTSYLSYYYYSFPVTGGNYNIQWAYTSHAGEANTEVKVSAYWNSKNSMTDLTVTYFSDATNGFASPRTIDAPDSGYIILKIYRNSSSYCNYSIRFYK